MALFGFDNSLGWWAFLSLIPFLLMYLIRPKPKELEVPSLMFFSRFLGVDQQKNFLRNIFRDWLFILQLLIILLLSVHFVKPYMFVEEESLLDHVVLVLDVSASMQAEGRFDKMIKEASGRIAQQTTVILVGSTPRTVLERADAGEVEELLKALKVTDERTAFGEAVLLAAEKATGESPKIVVISDFIATEHAETSVSIKAAESKGISVALVNVASGKKGVNYGIVRLEADQEDTAVYIKNFQDEDSILEIEVNGQEKSLHIKENSIESYSFKTPTGITEIRLPKDDLEADNKAWVVGPSAEKIQVLYVAKKPSPYLQAALEASSHVKVTVSRLPVIDDGDYDVYVLADYDASSIITGVVETLQEKVRAGAGLVVFAEQATEAVSWKGLLPVTMAGMKPFSSATIVQQSRFTKEIDFGSVQNYFVATPTAGVMLLSAEGNTSLLSLMHYGNGQVVYVGITEDTSDFELSPFYPIFLNKLLEHLAGREEMVNLHFATGSILPFNEPAKIETPNGVRTGSVLILDTVGIYRMKDRTIAANLLSEKESDAFSTADLEKGYLAASGEAAASVQYSLETWVLMGALLFILLELLCEKFRGEL